MNFKKEIERSERQSKSESIIKGMIGVFNGIDVNINWFEEYKYDYNIMYNCSTRLQKLFKRKIK